MKNFKSEVPAEVQKKLYAIAETIKDNLPIRGYHEMVIDPEIHEIEGNHRDGWIPHQDGGFNVCAYFADSLGDSPFTEKQKDATLESYNNCFQTFLSDNNLEADTSYDELTEDQKSDLADYENEWLQPALLEFQMFVEGYSGYWQKHPIESVTLRVSINYRDAPYYREKYAEDIKSIVLEIPEFLAMPIEEIINQLRID